MMINEFTEDEEDRVALKLETLSLYLHGPLGHVRVTVSNDGSVQVSPESVKYDYQVKEFANKLPKA